MPDDSFEVVIDLTPVANDLLLTLGQTGYSQLGEQLTSDLTTLLRDLIAPDAFRLETTPLLPSKSKDASALLIGSIAIMSGSAAVGYWFDPEKTRRVLAGAWAILKKLLPANIFVKVVAPGRSIEIKARDEPEARVLLVEAVSAMQQLPSTPTRTGKKTRASRKITLTATKR